MVWPLWVLDGCVGVAALLLCVKVGSQLGMGGGGSLLGLLIKGSEFIMVLREDLLLGVRERLEANDACGDRLEV